MAGYNGFSMSNNAVEAYNDGEMPLSKWTKSAILEAVKELELTNFSMDTFKKLQASELKRVALTKSSWHHTSSHYNKTDFYEISIASLETLTNQEINNIITQRGTLTTVAPKVEKWECRYLVWSGSRKHPKATDVVEVGEIIGNWFYTANNGKKSITGNGFQRIKQISKG